MSTRLQHNMDKKAPAQRLSNLSPVALVVMGLVGAADALASVREALQQSHTELGPTLSAKTTVMDYNAVASLVQALVREGVAPEEAALQVQFALQGPNPLAALSALVASVAEQAGDVSAQDTVSLPALVDALSQHVADLTENGQPFDLAMLQDIVPASSGFAQADLTQALEAYKALEQGVGAAQRGGNPEVAQNQIDLLLAQATQAGAAVATDAGAATAATATGAASGAAALGAMSAAQAIALVGLAAVAGGALSSSDPSTDDSSSGNVVKGPITGATVFRDLNGNYILDAGEASATTTTGGAYTLSGSGGKIVATGGTDSSTSLAFTGMLAAPAGATVVTPLTTLLAANSSLTAADLKAALGLSVDPLSFNPFATGVNAADAFKAEAAASQVNNILTSLALTANTASGGVVSLAEAVSAVANKLGAQVIAQAVTLKTTPSAGSLNLASDDVFSSLATSVTSTLNAKYSTLSLSTSAFDSVITGVKATNATIASATSVEDVVNKLKAAAPVANSSLLPDVSVAEDAALSGTGGTGSLTTLPSTFTATNIDRANLLKFFDNDSSTVGNTPTLTFDMTGYAVADADNGVSSLDLVVSLQKTAFAGRDLTVTLNDVKLDAAASSGNTTLTLPAQTISATVKMGSVALGTFNISNLDADALTLNSGANTVGASPSFSLKLDSLFAKMTNGVGDVLDLTTLSNKALVALGGALVVGSLDELTPASIVTKLKSLITLPSSVDTVSELVTLAKNVVDFPQVSSLKISDLLGQIPSGGTKTLLLAAASRANVDVTTATSDTVSSALTKFSTAFGTYKLSDLSTLLSNGLGLEQGADIVSVAKELVVAALNQAQGLTAEQILDKAIGALIDVNNGDLRALLAGIDYQSIVGTQVDALNVLNNIVQHGTVKYVDLINLGAHTLLSTDATMVVQATDFKNLAVTSGSASQTSLQVSVPLGSASTFTPPSNGLGIPVGAFTDPQSDTLTYKATLESGAALPSWLTFNASTKSFTGTPTNDNVGDLNIKITATDPAGNAVSDVFKLTVTNVNDAPQLVAGAVTSTTAVEFGAVNVNVASAFVDVDAGSSMTFTSSNLPQGWTLTSAGQLSGTAPKNETNSTRPTSISITASDGTAATTVDFTLNVTNDTVAPTVTLAAIGGSDTTISSTTSEKVITGTAAAGDGVVSVKFGSTLLGTATVASNGTYSYTLTDANIATIGQGASKSLVVTQTDLADNVGTSSTVTFAVDTIAPSVAITSVGGDSVVSSTPGDKSIVGTTENGATVTIKTGTTTLGTATANSSGAFTYEFTDENIVTLGQGSNKSITASVTDAAGNVGSATSSAFVVATRAPEVTITSVGGSDGFVTSVSGDNKVVGTANSGQSVIVKTGAGTILGSVVAGDDGVFNYTLTDANIATLGQGTSKSVIATQTDIASNTGTSPAKTFSIDTVGPANGPTVTFSDSLLASGEKAVWTVSGLGSDAASADIVFTQGSTTQTVTVTANGTASSTTAADLSNFSAGAVAVTIVAKDSLSNTTSGTGATVTIDKTAPSAPSITGFADNTGLTTDTLTKDTTPTLAITAEAGSVVKVYSGSTLLGSATEGNSGVFSYTTAPLAEGTYSVTATATDPSGNVSVASTVGTLTIDLTVPTLTESLSVSDAGVLSYTFAFSEKMLNFTADDIAVTGASKGTFTSASDGKTFTLAITPTASDVTVAVNTTGLSATDATDEAGNSLALGTSIARSIVFGSSAAETVNGTSAANLLWGGNGADTLIGGGGADQIFLNDESGSSSIDVIKYTAMTDSSSTAQDTIYGFTGSDQINFKSILGSAGGGAGYDAEFSVGLSTSPFILKSPTTSVVDGERIVSVEVWNNSTEAIEAAFLNFVFNTNEVTSVTYSGKTATTNLWYFLPDTSVSDGDLAFIAAADDSTDPAVAAGEKFVKVNFYLTDPNQTSFVFSVESAGVGVKNTKTEAGFTVADAPQYVTLGTPTLAIDGKAKVVFESSLTTVGENEVHLAFNKTTGVLQLQYDTNSDSSVKSVSSAILQIGGLTGLSDADLTKTDFAMFGT